MMHRLKKVTLAVLSSLIIGTGFANNRVVITADPLTTTNEKMPSIGLGTANFFMLRGLTGKSFLEALERSMPMIRGCGAVWLEMIKEANYCPSITFKFCKGNSTESVTVKFHSFCTASIAYKTLYIDQLAAQVCHYVIDQSSCFPRRCGTCATKQYDMSKFSPAVDLALDHPRNCMPADVQLSAIDINFYIKKPNEDPWANEGGKYWRWDGYKVEKAVCLTVRSPVYTLCMGYLPLPMFNELNMNDFLKTALQALNIKADAIKNKVGMLFKYSKGNDKKKVTFQQHIAVPYPCNAEISMEMMATNVYKELGPDKDAYHRTGAWCYWDKSPAIFDVSGKSFVQYHTLPHDVQLIEVDLVLNVKPVDSPTKPISAAAVVTALESTASAVPVKAVVPTITIIIFPPIAQDSTTTAVSPIVETDSGATKVAPVESSVSGTPSTSAPAVAVASAEPVKVATDFSEPASNLPQPTANVSVQEPSSNTGRPLYFFCERLNTNLKIGTRKSHTEVTVHNAEITNLTSEEREALEKQLRVGGATSISYN